MIQRSLYFRLKRPPRTLTRNLYLLIFYLFSVTHQVIFVSFILCTEVKALSLTKSEVFLNNSVTDLGAQNDSRRYKYYNTTLKKNKISNKLVNVRANLNNENSTNDFLIENSQSFDNHTNDNKAHRNLEIIKADTNPNSDRNTANNDSVWNSLRLIDDEMSSNVSRDIKNTKVERLFHYVSPEDPQRQGRISDRIKDKQKDRTLFANCSTDNRALNGNREPPVNESPTERADPPCISDKSDDGNLNLTHKNGNDLNYNPLIRSYSNEHRNHTLLHKGEENGLQTIFKASPGRGTKITDQDIVYDTRGITTDLYISSAAEGSSNITKGYLNDNEGNLITAVSTSSSNNSITNLTAIFPSAIVEDSLTELTVGGNDEDYGSPTKGYVSRPPPMKITSNSKIKRAKSSISDQPEYELSRTKSEKSLSTLLTPLDLTPLLKGKSKESKRVFGNKGLLKQSFPILYAKDEKNVTNPTVLTFTQSSTESAPKTTSKHIDKSYTTNEAKILENTPTSTQIPSIDQIESYSIDVSSKNAPKAENLYYNETKEKICNSSKACTEDPTHPPTNVSTDASTLITDDSITVIETTSFIVNQTDVIDQDNYTEANIFDPYTYYDIYDLNNASAAAIEDYNATADYWTDRINTPSTFIPPSTSKIYTDHLYYPVSSSTFPTATDFKNTSNPKSTNSSEDNEAIWPVKLASVVEGDIILGGLMMVHSREDSVTCGPIMPQGGIQALEAMLYTLDRLNSDPDFMPNVTLGAHILDDCDKDTYGLEMAVDFIKGKFIQNHL